MIIEVVFVVRSFYQRIPYPGSSEEARGGGECGLTLRNTSQEAVQHLDVARYLLSAAYGTRSLVDVFRNQFVSAIWLTVLSHFLTPSRNNLNQSCRSSVTP
jgi:hypothetical protein